MSSAQRLRVEGARSRGFAVFKQRLDFVYLDSCEILWNDNGLLIFSSYFDSAFVSRPNDIQLAPHRPIPS